MQTADSICLTDILQAKEDRAFVQRQLISRYHCPLISFTVNMPGPVKLNDASRLIYRQGIQAIRKALDLHGYLCLDERLLDKKTGLEGYFAVIGEQEDLKRLACSIEDEHPLGRLFDIDVLGRDFRPASRAALGLPTRQCLLCGQEAVVCIRTGSHSLPELLARIREMVARYLAEEQPDGL